MLLGFKAAVAELPAVIVNDDGFTVKENAAGFTVTVTEAAAVLFSVLPESVAVMLTV